MDSIPAYNEEQNLKRVFAGYRGSNRFQKPLMTPSRSFVEGWPAEVIKNVGSEMPAKSTPVDTWNSRR